MHWLRQHMQKRWQSTRPSAPRTRPPTTRANSGQGPLVLSKMNSRKLVLGAGHHGENSCLPVGPGLLLSVWAANVKMVRSKARVCVTQHVVITAAGVIHHSLYTGLCAHLFLCVIFMLTVTPWGGTVNPHFAAQERKAQRDEATRLKSQVRGSKRHP